MELRQIIGSGITASAIAHLSALMLVVFFAEVHPFSSTAPEPIAVDLVSPAEVEPSPKPEQAPQPKPSDAFDLATPSPPSTPPPATPPVPAAAPAAPAPPQQQAAPSTPRPDRHPTNAQAPAAKPQPATTAPQPAYTAPEPDLSIKYHVMLGLPPQLPQQTSGDRPGDGFDAPASEKADVASNLVAEFRRHLKTCSTLPESLSASDKIRIKLRVFMTPEGRLATEPILIEASASPKGPALMQSAIAALDACQPYQMLPAERYGEWKVLDLSFTPQDFTGS